MRVLPSCRCGWVKIIASVIARAQASNHRDATREQRTCHNPGGSLQQPTSPPPKTRCSVATTSLMVDANVSSCTTRWHCNSVIAARSGGPSCLLLVRRLLPVWCLTQWLKAPLDVDPLKEIKRRSFRLLVWQRSRTYQAALHSDAQEGVTEAS